MSDDHTTREIDEDCTIERVNSLLQGDKMIAKMDDALRRAVPLCEAGKISPLAMSLIGTLFRFDDEHGLSLSEARAWLIRGHDGSPQMAEGWDRAIDQLKQHNLLPAGMTE